MKQHYTHSLLCARKEEWMTLYFDIILGIVSEREVRGTGSLTYGKAM